MSDEEEPVRPIFNNEERGGLGFEERERDAEERMRRAEEREDEGDEII